ncbi:MAG: D-aminoacyl-tRNA deacylase [Candidatus Caldarchaeum sp.]|nr:D-aminoacyl-tRNA deacylase [Candidatus Caldarchaeum sp.]
MSLTDQAAVNILQRLVENFGFRQLSPTLYRKDVVDVICVEGSMLNADDQVAKVDADLILVASKHVSESGRPCILAHSTGNWGASAEYGGRPEKLSMTSARALYATVHRALEAVDSLGLKNVEVGMEATHHGPYSEKPLIFVELGSSPREWIDSAMAEAVAQTIHNVCFDTSWRAPEPAAGFGGGHYARDILRQVLDHQYCVGHVASKHHFPLSNKATAQAFTRTIERPRTALIDWDGLKSEHRNQLLQYLAELDVVVVKV